MYGSQWGSLAAARSLQKAVFFTTSHARIRISTTSHAIAREFAYQILQVTCTASAMKSKVRMIKSPQYQAIPEKYHLFVAAGGNTDGNKLVIFSGIALYYGDTYIIS